MLHSRLMIIGTFDYVFKLYSHRDQIGLTIKKIKGAAKLLSCNFVRTSRRQTELLCHESIRSMGRVCSAHSVQTWQIWAETHIS